MAGPRIAIHIPTDANPTNVAATNELLTKEPGLTFRNNTALTARLTAEGIGNRSEIAATALDLCLLHKTEGGISISETGLAWSRAREAIRGDLLHFLFFSRWTPELPLEFLKSWSYRQICLIYWKEASVDLTTAYIARTVEEVKTRAEMLVEGVGDLDDTSFGPRSIRGAHNWLSALTPPVLENSTFTRRTFCPPELLVLAFGYALREEEGVTEFDILLTPDRRAAICQVCLLDPDYLDKTLDWAMSVFPDLISPGTSAGFYGRFVRLHKLPSIEDVVR